MGRLGSDSPARLRRMALATAETASSCPTTRSCRVDSRRTSFWISPFHQARDRHAGPAAHHLRDVLGVDLFLQEAGARLQLGQVVGGLDNAPLNVGQLAVADGRGAGEVALALEPHGVVAPRRLLLLEQADGVDGRLLLLPVRRHPVALLGQVGQLRLQLAQALGRGVVGLLLQRHLLDLELTDAPDHLVQFGRQRVDLDAQLAGRLVDEIDGLVRQEAAGDVAIGEDGGGDQRSILDAHAVVHLVALLEPAQNGDGVFDRGLTDEHRLEAALQRGVLLDGGAVLVERGGADEPELAARQHRLDHLPGIHGSLGGAGAHNGVQLVNEGHHFALGVGDLLEDGLEPLLELAPVLGAGHHGRQVERDDPLALQPFGNVALDDPVGQPLDDGGLAHAGLTDQHRVVLGAPRQDLDDPPDLLVTPDDRVELAVAGGLGEVAPVLGQRLVGLLGVGRRHPVVAPHGTEAGEQRVLGDPDLVGQGQQEVLDRDVVVPQLAPDLVGRLQHVAGLAGQARLGAALGPRQPVQLLAHLVRQRVGVHADLGEQGPGHRLLLLEQRVEQVGRRHLGVVRRGRVPRRRAEGSLGVIGPAFRIDGHVLYLLV